MTMRGRTLLIAVTADRLLLLTGGKEFLAAAPPGSAKWVARKFDWSGTELGTHGHRRRQPETPFQRPFGIG
jgi:hypothetical protein